MGLQSKAYFPKIGYIISNSCISDVVFVRCEEMMSGFSCGLNKILSLPLPIFK